MTRCKFAAKSKLPIQFGDFEICAFEEDSGKEHIALVLGKIENQENVRQNITTIKQQIEKTRKS